MRTEHHAATGGFGPGLSLVRLIADAHDGALRIDGEPAVSSEPRLQVVLATSAAARFC